MSYCRIGDGSDVYMYANWQNEIECCGCLLQQTMWVEDKTAPFGGYLQDIGPHIETVFDTPSIALAHLAQHKLVGHMVPQYAIDRLEAEESCEQKGHRWEARTFEWNDEYRTDIWCAHCNTSWEWVSRFE